MMRHDRDDVERSGSGSPIYRYELVERESDDFEPPTQDEEALERLEEHIDKYVGDGNGKGLVWHEIVSDLVHIDVHMIPPTAERNYYTLVTTGMSDRPMSTPPGAEEWQYAELVTCLPADWPLAGLEGKILDEEENYWPVRALKFLARFPHEYDTWLGWGHTIPNGDPPAPFASNTKLCCSLLLSLVLFGEDFPQLRVRQDKVVNIYSLVPLYEDEMNYKLKHGSDALLSLLEEHGVTELLNPQRRNVCLPGS